VLAVVASGLAIRYRSQTSIVVLRVAEWVTTLQHKDLQPEPIQKTIDDLYADWDVLHQSKWQLLVLGGFLVIICDIMTLYFLFVAAGNNISLGVLLSGYALPLLLGRIAFIFPGGVGIVESSMVALYSGLGIPSATAVVVTLGYRLISFWLPSILGFPIAAYFQHKESEITIG